MSNIWVVVADSSRARFFTADKPNSALAEKKSLEHPESRMHEQELTSDLPGRSFDSGGQGRHAMGSAVGPKRQEAIRFAKEVTERLESERNHGGFHKLYVVAAPAFLGFLRDNFSNPMSGKVASFLDKNLVDHDAPTIRTHLPEYL